MATQDVSLWDETNTNSVSVTTDSKLKTQNTYLGYESLLSSNISIGLSATEVKVGGSRLTGRRNVTIYNNTATNAVIYIGYSNAVTSANGIPLYKNQMISIDIGDVAIWSISTVAATDVRIMEMA